MRALQNCRLNLEIYRIFICKSIWITCRMMTEDCPGEKRAVAQHTPRDTVNKLYLRFAVLKTFHKSGYLKIILNIELRSQQATMTVKGVYSAPASIYRLKKNTTFQAIQHNLYFRYILFRPFTI